MRCTNELMLNLWIDWIEQEGLRTGSQIIGGATEKSDYDYVITQEKVEEKALQLCLSDECREVDMKKYGTSFLSFKYKRSDLGKWINLIVVPEDIDLMAWDHATFMTCAASGYVRSVTKRRHTYFQWMLNDYYNSIGKPERADRAE
jgi:hypothetical protein